MSHFRGGSKGEYHTIIINFIIKICKIDKIRKEYFYHILNQKSDTEN